MEPFRRHTAIAVPYDQPNVDTDQIIPARFLRRKRSSGFASFLFHDLRQDEQGRENPDFILNKPAYRKAGILVADNTFGSGSSREQAAWSLVDYGIRSVVASSFGDIFYNNSFKNGLLPVRLADDIVRGLRAQLHATPGSQMTIDLEEQVVIGPKGDRYPFEIEPFRKRCLMLALDDIGITLEYEKQIAAFEQTYKGRRPWVAR
ncbi:MAG: 3-isopropylmalate dehydratase small subunit [Alphaproteobacteria bacterium]|nr:3-isopropylmalate dehydratase small subunit [Alphaproteobacteria bacterium]